MANAAGSGDKSAIRMKRRNETKIIMRQSIIYPLVKVLLFNLTGEIGAVSPPQRRRYSPPSRYLKTSGYAILLYVIMAMLVTFVGLPLPSIPSPTPTSPVRTF